MEAVIRSVRGLGHRIVNVVQRMGVAARFFVLTLLHSGPSFRRFQLILHEIFTAASLAI